MKFSDRYNKVLLFEIPADREHLPEEVKALIHYPVVSEIPLRFKIAPKLRRPLSPNGLIDFYFLPGDEKQSTSVHVKIIPRAVTIETFLLVSVFLVLPAFGVALRSYLAAMLIPLIGLIVFGFLAHIAQTQTGKRLEEFVKRKMNALHKQLV